MNPDDGYCHCDGPPHPWSPDWCPPRESSHSVDSVKALMKDAIRGNRVAEAALHEQIMANSTAAPNVPITLKAIQDEIARIAALPPEKATPAAKNRATMEQVTKAIRKMSKAFDAGLLTMEEFTKSISELPGPPAGIYNGFRNPDDAVLDEMDDEAKAPEPPEIEVRWVHHGLMGREFTPNDCRTLILNDIKMNGYGDTRTVRERASAWLTEFTKAIGEVIRESEQEDGGG